MSDAPIRWEGLSPEDIAAKANAHPFSESREQLMTRVTLLALRSSQPLTPVDTGLLRRSETTAVEVGGLRGWIGSNVVYAPFVHARVPFFEMGIDAARPEIDRLMEETGDAYWKAAIS